MFEEITPVILTFNEAENIERVLNMLEWANDIVVVDSFSIDETINILSKYKKIRLFKRKFDMHANQWNYAIKETDIKSDWILALDADYVLSKELNDEIKNLSSDKVITGYKASFNYCIFGKALKSSLYPPVTILFRNESSKYIQDGHTQRLITDGGVKPLNNVVYHDDRKPFMRWVKAQNKYMNIESKLIYYSKWKELKTVDRLRKLVVFSPVITFFYCLIVKKGILDGMRGLYYAIQRTLAESILSLKLIQLFLDVDNKKCDGQ